MSKILIVDDDEMTIGIYSARLMQDGFDVISAHNGKVAWEMIQAGQIPDAVFTGIVMPEMNGFELIEKLRSDPKSASIPVAIFSHRNRPEDREKAERLGIKDFIVQGFTTPIEVVRRLELLLGIKKKFKITFLPDRYDGQALVDLLNKQEEIIRTFSSTDLAVLELEPEKENGRFAIRLTGEKEPK